MSREAIFTYSMFQFWWSCFNFHSFKPLRKLYFPNVYLISSSNFKFKLSNINNWKTREIVVNVNREDTKMRSYYIILVFLLLLFLTQWTTKYHLEYCLILEIVISICFLLSTMPGDPAEQKPFRARISKH